MAVQSTLMKNFLSILDCPESVVHSTIIVPTLVPITLSACVCMGNLSSGDHDHGLVFHGLYSLWECISK